MSEVIQYFIGGQYCAAHGSIGDTLKQSRVLENCIDHSIEIIPPNDIQSIDKLRKCLKDVEKEFLDLDCDNAPADYDHAKRNVARLKMGIITEILLTGKVNTANYKIHAREIKLHHNYTDYQYDCACNEIVGLWEEGGKEDE